jgi:hypothetical protein
MMISPFTRALGNQHSGHNRMVFDPHDCRLGYAWGKMFYRIVGNCSGWPLAEPCERQPEKSA